MTDVRVARFGAGLALALLAGVSTAALAQDAAAPAPAAEDNSYGDIIVTAQKRAERLQDVPVSVRA